MREIIIVGNPNVGKSTLFNCIVKGNAHTGNFHGVTVEDESKIINFENEKLKIVDLPGMYSLNSFSYEEEVAKVKLLDKKNEILVVVDANCLRKNLYLCLQMSELNLNYKILINNYDYFIKHKNKFNLKNFKKYFNNAEIINAKKCKPSKNLLNIGKYAINCNYLEKYVNIVKNKYNLEEKTIILALNGIYSSLNLEQIKFFKSLISNLIKDRYNYIDTILKETIDTDKNYVYGLSGLDKFLLNPFVMTISFLLIFFSSIYVIFFLIGPLLTDLLTKIFEFMIIIPATNFLCRITDNIWLIEFFTTGVFNSFVTILSFLPQICLLYVFLTVLEDSGLIARMSYVFDDFLSHFGLSGKSVYVMLLGLGCNTMSTMASRGMNEKNLKIKTMLANPFVSCMARLPIFVIVASAIFSKYAYFVVAGLYVLGILIAFIVGLILDKTILKTETNNMMLEFPPLRGVDIKHVISTAKLNAQDLIKRVFSVVMCVGVVVWILTHTQFNLVFTQNISESIMFKLSNIVSILFVPIGLNNAGIVCALIVGLMAKELIVSTMSICNGATSTAGLIASLVSVSSTIHFGVPSAVSFLIFALLYAPCVSNLAVIKKEIGKFYMWFALIGQFTLAYILCFIVYQTLTKGLLFTIIISLAISIILVSIIFLIKRLKKRKITCLFCNKCK